MMDSDVNDRGDRSGIKSKAISRRSRPMRSARQQGMKRERSVEQVGPLSFLAILGQAESMTTDQGHKSKSRMCLSGETGVYVKNDKACGHKSE